MKATVQVSFYNDDVKSKLQELNQLLNPYGSSLLRIRKS